MTSKNNNVSEEIKAILDKYGFTFDYGINFYRKDLDNNNSIIFIISVNGGYKIEYWTYGWDEEEGDISYYNTFYSDNKDLDTFLSEFI